MPTEKRVTRKLRAILSADVKGYSILMADDEIFTIKTIKEYRGIMSNCIEQHNGRVVDSPGDNMLAEFASAVDAVQCAVEMQKQLKKENDRLVEDKRLEFRIGVNIGDVVQDENRIYGDGVNIAARIEGLADEIIAPDYADNVAGDGSPVGPDGFKQAVAGIKAAFPDFSITIDDMISESDHPIIVSTHCNIAMKGENYEQRRSNQRGFKSP